MKNKMWKKTVVSLAAACVLGSTVGVSFAVHPIVTVEAKNASKVVVTKEYETSKNVRGTKPDGKKVKIFEFAAKFPKEVSVDGNEAAGEKISMSFSNIIKDIKKEYKEYKAEAKEYFLQAPENMGKNKGFYELVYDYGQETQGNMYSVLSSMTCYMMGAHGGFVQTGYNYDLRTGEKAALEQILPFKTDADLRKKLVAYIKQYVAKEMGEAVIYEDLNWDEFFGENPVYDVTFAVMDGKFTLIFNQYDIAPYAAGIIYVPLDESMEKYFTEYGKELLGMEG